MANYLAQRIIEMGEKSIEEGQRYYKTFMSIPRYAIYKNEIDAQLMLNGNEELIVEIK